MNKIKTTYILSDINKAVFFEHTALLMRARGVEISWILINSKDSQLAAIAEKSLKETKYHLRHTSEWIIRLGDGTNESHQRIQKALDNLWRFTDEIFYKDEVDEELTSCGILPNLSDLRSIWENTVKSVFTEATILIPSNNLKSQGGRKGRHSEHMGFILSDLQYMQRTYPNLEW